MPLQATSGAASYDAFGGGVPVIPAYIEEVFQTWLYTGNGSTQTITNGIDLAGKGGLVWQKNRTTAVNNTLFDTARGNNNYLYTDSTAAQNSAANFCSLTSSGFTLGTAYSNNNSSGDNFVSWSFRKQPKFFDVVTYTGNGATTAREIAHSVGSVPGCIIVFPINDTGDRKVYHRSLGSGKALKLQTTDQSANVPSWGNTDPTSTNFYVAYNEVNKNGINYVAYLFAHDAGGFGLTGTDNVISCGSFNTGAGDDVTVSLGYEPQWVMVKPTNQAYSWEVYDNMRGMGNTFLSNLNPNLTQADNYQSTSTGLVPSATGFRSSAYWGANTNLIYIAIRRGPMKVPTSGTSVFSPALEWTPNSNIMGYLGAPADMEWIGYRNGASINVNARTRLTGGNRLSTSSTAAEIVDSTNYWDNQLGFNQTAGSSGTTYAMWTGRRAPSFLDVVCYSGTGSATTQTHNLGVAPELIIVKGRNTNGSTADSNWAVWSNALTTGYNLFINSDSAEYNGNGAWFGSTPSTSTTFGASESNASAKTYVAYLFATCAGVSKVGSYTGTGTTKQVDCGFTGGARFVLIKRTDSTGDWYVWDSARGIVSGNDPYLRLNSTAAEVTNTDYIDTYSAGFEISSTAPAAINASGGTFIFLAIA